MTNNQLKFKKLHRQCMHTVLDLHKRANTGHLSCSLCCVDLMVYLHFFKMTSQDQFILSKGHSASGLYAVLAAAGKISTDLLDTYYKDGTLLGTHPPCGLNKIPSIMFGTGSLGHGLSLATGVALANRLKHKKSKIYCLVSDGECNEGSIWEAALFAGHHQLSDVCVIVDDNGLQGFGATKEVLDMHPMKNKWRDFGFEVTTADGHSYRDLERAFKEVACSKKPKCIIAKTDAGISFMKHQMAWHYHTMDDEQYRAAKAELDTP